MLSILRQQTPRTTTAHLNPIKYDGGRASQHFHDTSHQYMVTDIMPATTPQHGRSFFNPPLHFHIYQTEDFEIISGIAHFCVDDTKIVAKAGDKVHIPMAAFHRFANASEDGEDLIVTFRLDKQDFDVEERFFRNFFGYFDDAVKAGQEPSFFQLCLFLYTLRAPIVLPGLGQRSTFVGRQLSWFVMVFAGVVVGEWLLGYKRSYEEYYQSTKEEKKEA